MNEVYTNVFYDTSNAWLGRFSEAACLQQKAYESFLALGEMGLVAFIEIDMANLA